MSGEPMTESELDYYHRVDMQAYRDEIAPVLPAQVLDMHAHVWPTLVAKHNKYPALGEFKGVPDHYTFADLDASAKRLFPDRVYHAVCFGAAFPEAVEAGENDRIAQGAREWPRRYPLLIAGPHDGEQQLHNALQSGGFYGFKVAVNLETQHYATDRIMYVFSEAQRKLANELGLIVMLHIPRSKRLADSENVSDIQHICREYPNLKLVLAHLGRAYCSWVIKDSIKLLKDLPNLYWDVSYVQNETVFQIVMENVDPTHIVFGTDQPLAEFRGRRVCVNNAWVDVTRDRYSWSAFCREGLEIEATFVAYEIIRAMTEGAERAGLTREQLRAMFFDNGMKLVEDVARRNGLRK